MLLAGKKRRAVVNNKLVNSLKQMKGSMTVDVDL